MKTVITIILALLVFCVLILIHELGHFLAAKWAGVTVNEFSIGMGPCIFKWKGKQTQYSIRLFPIGGFVQMEGEDSESDDENAFCKKSVWKRMVIVVAGALMNVILGLIIVFSIVLMSENLGSTQIAKFIDGAQSSHYLKEGDQIVSIGGYKILTYQDIGFAISKQMNTNPVDVIVKRNNEKITIPNVKFKSEKINDISVSVQDFAVKAEDKNIITVLKHTGLQTAAFIRMVWSSLVMLVSGQVGFDQVAGPVGITSELGKAASMGVLNFLFLVALITINLGVFNMLPLPALDGGRFIFLIIEAIRRKPINQKIEGTINTVGFMLLMALVVFVLFNDVMRLFG